MGFGRYSRGHGEPVRHFELGSGDITNLVLDLSLAVMWTNKWQKERPGVSEVQVRDDEGLS